MPPRGRKEEELRKNAPTNFTIKSAKQVNAFFFLRPNKFINFAPTHFLQCIFSTKTACGGGRGKEKEKK